MHSAVDSLFAPSPERLRLVTESFYELQGLTKATLGSYLVFINLFRLHRSGVDPLIYLVITILAFLFVLASLKHAPRYYRWRFGVMEQRTDPPNWSLKPFLGVVAVILVYFVIDLVYFVTDRTIGFSRLNGKGVDFELILFVVGMFVYLALKRPQLMRLRQSYLIPASMVVAAVTLFSICYTPDERQLAVLKALNANLIPFVLIVMGLGDHMLLLRLMPKRVLEDDL